MDEIHLLDNKHKKLSKESTDLKNSIQTSEQLISLKSGYQHNMIIDISHETQTELLSNDFKILNQCEKELTKIINYIERYISKSTLNEITFKRFSALELLTGIKIVEKAMFYSPSLGTQCNDTIALVRPKIMNQENLLSYYNILFLKVLDECLNPDNTESGFLKTLKSKLSAELTEKYQSQFKVCI